MCARKLHKALENTKHHRKLKKNYTKNNCYNVSISVVKIIKNAHLSLPTGNRNKIAKYVEKIYHYSWAGINTCPIISLQLGTINFLYPFSHDTQISSYKKEAHYKDRLFTLHYYQKD